MTAGNDDTVASSLPSAPGGEGAIPELVAERYQIVRWLGGGGMGRVYEALDTELGESIALKVLRAGLADDAVERFRREVRLTRRIQHRNIARMFDIGDHRGEKFLTMELVAGEPLSHVASHAGRLEWERLRQFAVQICEGLAAAHLAGVIHRDLKPDNVLIERGTERVVITDFGIARAGTDTSVTLVGAIVGTPRYMAPEQLAGSELDARADLFALGVMLYELATGARPWPGDNAIAIAVAQVTQPPRPFSSARVPPAFAELVMQLIALELALRPASATEVAQRLVAMADTAPPSPAPDVSGAVARPTPLPTNLSMSAAAGSSATTATTLAVLGIASAPEDAHLTDVVREELADALSTGALRVKPATPSALALADPREAGRSLAVDVVVVGSLRRAGGKLRISVRLIGIEDGFQIFAQRAECGEGALFTTCEELSRGIALALSQRAITPSLAASAKPTDPRAVELYLQARAELRRFWGSHAVRAVELLEQAAALAPESASIVATLALAHTQAWVRQADARLLAPARAAVERALHMGHGEAYIAAASLAMNTGDVLAAARYAGVGLTRAPMAASTHEMAARLLVEVGAIDEARRHFETAVALDGSRTAPIAVELARIDGLFRNWDTVDRRNSELAADPDLPIREAGALSTLRMATWRRDLPATLAAADGFRLRLGPVSHALIEFTRRWLEHRTFDAERWRSSVAIAAPDGMPVRTQLIYLQRAAEVAMTLEQPDSAMLSLDFAASRGLIDIVWLDRCPLFDTLRDDPRFLAMRAGIARRAAAVLAAFRTTTAGPVLPAVTLR